MKEGEVRCEDRGWQKGGKQELNLKVLVEMWEPGTRCLNEMLCCEAYWAMGPWGPWEMFWGVRSAWLSEVGVVRVAGSGSDGLGGR